jgi:hypothetical protein
VSSTCHRLIVDAQNALAPCWYRCVFQDPSTRLKYHPLAGPDVTLIGVRNARFTGLPERVISDRPLSFNPWRFPYAIHPQSPHREGSDRDPNKPAAMVQEPALANMPDIHLGLEGEPATMLATERAFRDANLVRREWRQKRKAERAAETHTRLQRAKRLLTFHRCAPK